VAAVEAVAAAAVVEAAVAVVTVVAAAVEAAAEDAETIRATTATASKSLTVVSHEVKTINLRKRQKKATRAVRKVLAVTISVATIAAARETESFFFSAT
jgi:hypothetical protein